jgi:UDPglucose 6-dehydrogenase
MRVSVVGLGQLGLAFAASVAKSGIPVSGVDIDIQRVEQIKQNPSSFSEPKMTEYIQQSSDSLSVTTDSSKAVPNADTTFVFVNTYNDDETGYSLDALESATRDVGRALADDEGPHLVVIRSTVMPGVINSQIVEWLKTESGRTVGEEIMLGYWPEFTALGQVIDSMEHPEYRVVGEHTQSAGDRLKTFIEEWQPNTSRTVRMNILDAEVTKMALNAYIAMKLSFVNHLGRVCDGVGANVDSVTDAVANDSRISGEYFSAGVRYGGPCFPHDNVAFEELTNMAETTAPLARAADEINHTHTEWIGDIVRDVTDQHETVAVLGLTYKPGVPVTRESQGIELVSYLKEDLNVITYDPIASLDTSKRSNEITVSDNLEESIATADTAILTVKHEVLIDESIYEDITLIDPWRVFEAERLPDSVTYRPLGRSK